MFKKWQSIKGYDIDLMYAIKSPLSFEFLIPAKTILVPGIYFFGFSKYANRCFSVQTIPDSLLASVYENSCRPERWPNTPKRHGPLLLAPSLTIVWHWEHLALNILAPFFAFPAGTSTSGSGRMSIEK